MTHDSDYGGARGQLPKRYRFFVVVAFTIAIGIAVVATVVVVFFIIRVLV
jgi:hypothetical protein